MHEPRFEYDANKRAFRFDMLSYSIRSEKSVGPLRAARVGSLNFAGIELVLGLTIWVHFLPLPLNSTV